MYTLIIIFYIALVGIITMILLKRYEIKSGKPTIFSRMGKSIDETLSEIFQSVKMAISHINRKNFVALMHFVAFHILFQVRKIYVELKYRTLQNPHGKKMIDAVRGRGEVKNHGASFYLRRISDK